MRNFNNRSYNFPDDDRSGFEKPVYLPKRLPDQGCPRCGNTFPGGLKRCTACGLDITRVRLKPDAALPWPGYDRGLIICKFCNHTNLDDMARNGKVQKCGLCSKIIYIPSGLHSPYYEPNILRRQTVGIKTRWEQLYEEALDIAGATWKRFMRTNYKWLALVLVIALIGWIGYSTFGKGKAETKAVVQTPAMAYYEQILPLRSAITQSIENFRIVAGDVPTKLNFNYWRNPNNRERFVRASDETLKVITTSIDQLRGLKDRAAIPPEAMDHHAKMLEMLYAQQIYYARLKDGLNNNDQKYWNTAFDSYDKLSGAVSAENTALETLRNLVLTSKNATKQN